MKLGWNFNPKDFFTRRALFYRLGRWVLVSVAALAYGRNVEAGWVRRSEFDYLLKGLKKRLKLIHISDLHAENRYSANTIEQTVARVISERPDLICLTGDLVTHDGGFDRAWYVEVLRRLQNQAPTFVTLGNHDGGNWSMKHGSSFIDSSFMQKVVTDSGANLLHNQRTVFHSGDAELQLIGFGDLWAKELDAKTPFLEASELPTILLSHNPDTKVLFHDQHWQLMLSGHTHGGQIFWPLSLATAPVKDKRFIEGLVPWQETPQSPERHVHISRGVGSTARIRIGCPPEYTVINLHG
jgi:uncharacterized protein